MTADEFDSAVQRAARTYRAVVEGHAFKPVSGLPAEEVRARHLAIAEMDLVKALEAIRAKRT